MQRYYIDEDDNARTIRDGRTGASVVSVPRYPAPAEDTLQAQCDSLNLGRTFERFRPVTRDEGGIIRSAEGNRGGWRRLPEGAQVEASELVRGWGEASALGRVNLPAEGWTLALLA